MSEKTGFEEIVTAAKLVTTLMPNDFDKMPENTIQILNEADDPHSLVGPIETGRWRWCSTTDPKTGAKYAAFEARLQSQGASHILHVIEQHAPQGSPIQAEIDLDHEIACVVSSEQRALLNLAERPDIKTRVLGALSVLADAQLSIS